MDNKQFPEQEEPGFLPEEQNFPLEEAAMGLLPPDETDAPAETDTQPLPFPEYTPELDTIPDAVAGP